MGAAGDAIKENPKATTITKYEGGKMNRKQRRAQESKEERRIRRWQRFVAALPVPLLQVGIGEMERYFNLLIAGADPPAKSFPRPSPHAKIPK